MYAIVLYLERGWRQRQRRGESCTDGNTGMKEDKQWVTGAEQHSSSVCNTTHNIITFRPIMCWTDGDMFKSLLWLHCHLKDGNQYFRISLPDFHLHASGCICSWKQDEWMFEWTPQAADLTDEMESWEHTATLLSNTNQLHGNKTTKLLLQNVSQPKHDRTWEVMKSYLFTQWAPYCCDVISDVISDVSLCFWLQFR